MRARKVNRIKLNRRMGLELSFEPKRVFKVPENEERFLRRKLNTLKSLGYKGYVDGEGCLEINTPVFSYLDEALSFWDKLIGHLGDDMVTRRPDSTGGGLHIHIDQHAKNPKKVDPVFLANVMGYVYQRPWTSWALQDPSDDNTSLPLAYDDRVFGKLVGGIRGEEGFDKVHSVSPRDIAGSKTIELRFFDTCDSQEDLRNSILIANLICSRAMDNRGSAGRPYFDYSSNLRGFLQFAALSGVSLKYWIKCIDRMDQKFLWGTEVPSHVQRADIYFTSENTLTEKKIRKLKIEVLGELAREARFELWESHVSAEHKKLLKELNEVFLVHLVATGIHYGVKIEKVKKNAKNKDSQRKPKNSWFDFTHGGKRLMVNF